jgi:hypothetical protein
MRMTKYILMMVIICDLLRSLSDRRKGQLIRSLHEIFLEVKDKQM